MGFTAAHDLATWESHDLFHDEARLRITSVPGEHAPAPLRRLFPPVMGSVLELHEPGSAPFRVYLSGDTLYRPWLRAVVDRCGPLDAAVLHLGGTRILGVLLTMDGAQGADLVALLEPATTVPVHYGEYTVMRSPLCDFVARWQERDLPGRLLAVRHGQTVDLARMSAGGAG